MSQRRPDFWIRLVGIALLTALALRTDDTFQQAITGRVLIRFLFILTSLVITWHINRAIIFQDRTRAAFTKHRAVRWLLILLSCTLATTLVNWLISCLEYGLTHGTLREVTSHIDTTSLTLNQTTLRLSTYGLDWLHGLINALFYLVLYRIVFFLEDSSLYRQRLAQVEKENEHLQITNLQSQLAVLKQQVNPHFLFNALNSLSALIAEEPKQAEAFVDKLSEVYRYVLQANEQSLTTLEAELGFLEAYYHLLKTRYGDGFSLRVEVEWAHQTSQLPPLTLQLLVENAVKHNVVSPKRPLQILVRSTSQGGLSVSNTLQRKSSRVLSNGVGLSNILAKYQLLDLPAPEVEETEDQFTVHLSLRVEPSV